MHLVILDRDGVINQDSAEYIKSPAEWRPIPGSPEAIARLNRAGYRVVVATNQSGIGRGMFDVETLNAIHERMRSALAEVGGSVDAVFFCPHRPQDACACRKPKPGLLLEIAARLRVSLAGVPVIGDAYRDVEAALAAGARPILVRTGKGRRTLTKHGPLVGVPVYDDLAAAVSDLLAPGNGPAPG
ncbi:MAG: D-glycero-beta-D-manno-heptose 1,7-bisphosphate 7-phosphatase [Gammaproteobacteria bacterium]|nr:D-glycero-beta-D-manno-heptose 1,7-bisphosphate 7-phosphatase [Gammaproteobacteria bacterium]